MSPQLPSGVSTGTSLYRSDFSPRSAVRLSVDTGSAGFGDYIFVLDSERIGCGSAFVDLDEIAEVVGLAAAQHQCAHGKLDRGGRGINGDLARGGFAVKGGHSYYCAAFSHCGELSVRGDGNYVLVAGSIGHLTAPVCLPL